MHVFNGKACFSPSVPADVQALWAEHGGTVAATHENDADWFFCMGCDDPWLAELSSRLIVVFHAHWVTATASANVPLPLSKYVLDMDGRRDIRAPRRQDSKEEQGSFLWQDAIDPPALTIRKIQSNWDSSPERKRLRSSSPERQQVRRRVPPYATPPSRTSRPPQFDGLDTPDYSVSRDALAITADKDKFDSHLLKISLQSPAPPGSKVQGRLEQDVSAVSEGSSIGEFVAAPHDARRLPPTLWETLDSSGDRSADRPIIVLVSDTLRALEGISIETAGLFVPGKAHLGRELRYDGEGSEKRRKTV